MAKIEHVFVLMLENRSFDHMFAFSGLAGVVPPANPQFGANSPDRVPSDPPHEYEDVKKQISGGSMNGFVGDGLQGLKPSLIPRLMELAQNFVLMDNWYSSMPGPTWPNRMFAHAASSCGLDNSLSNGETLKSVISPSAYLNTPNGHIFERCVAGNVTWRIYKSDPFVQTMAMRGMVDLATAPGNQDKFFRDTYWFASDLKSGDAAQYTFIEPRFNILNNYRNGNSMHPLGSVAAGDQFVYQIYSAIRKSAVWESSLLVVSWDEHGGFYDHVTPPAAPPPGEPAVEQEKNHRREAAPGDCKFDALGPRVPALLISPYMPKGKLGSALFPGSLFDHSSIVASLRETFPALGAPLTDRDRNAPTWTSGLLPKIRTDISMPTAVAKIKAMSTGNVAASRASTKQKLDGNLAGFGHVAALVDWSMAKHASLQPLAVSHFTAKRMTAHALLQGRKTLDQAPVISRNDMLRYIAAVERRANTYIKSQTTVHFTKLTGNAPKKRAKSRPAKKRRQLTAKRAS